MDYAEAREAADDELEEAQNEVVIANDKCDALESDNAALTAKLEALRERHEALLAAAENTVAYFGKYGGPEYTAHKVIGPLAEVIAADKDATP